MDIFFEGERAWAVGVAVDPLENFLKVILGVDAFERGGLLEEIAHVGQLQMSLNVGFLDGRREDERLRCEQEHDKASQLKTHLKIK
jgi:hypothetical protein